MVGVGGWALAFTPEAVLPEAEVVSPGRARRMRGPALESGPAGRQRPRHRAALLDGPGSRPFSLRRPAQRRRRRYTESRPPGGAPAMLRPSYVSTRGLLEELL